MQDIFFSTDRGSAELSCSEDPSEHRAYGAGFAAHLRSKTPSRRPDCEASKAETATTSRQTHLPTQRADDGSLRSNLLQLLPASLRNLSRHTRPHTATAEVGAVRPLPPTAEPRLTLAQRKRKNTRCRRSASRPALAPTKQTVGARAEKLKR